MLRVTDKDQAKEIAGVIALYASGKTNFSINGVPVYVPDDNYWNVDKLADTLVKNTETDGGTSPTKVGIHDKFANFERTGNSMEFSDRGTSVIRQPTYEKHADFLDALTKHRTLVVDSFGAGTVVPTSKVFAGLKSISFETGGSSSPSVHLSQLMVRIPDKFKNPFARPVRDLSDCVNQLRKKLDTFPSKGGCEVYIMPPKWSVGTLTFDELKWIVFEVSQSCTGLYYAAIKSDNGVFLSLGKEFVTIKANLENFEDDDFNTSFSLEYGMNLWRHELEEIDKFNQFWRQGPKTRSRLTEASIRFFSF